MARERRSPVGEIQDVAYHRNGIAGEGFIAVTFTGAGDVEGQRFVGILFDTSDPETGETSTKDTGRCAVLDIDMLADGTITFGHNSWRGDNFEHDLRVESRRILDEEWKARYPGLDTETEGV